LENGEAVTAQIILDDALAAVARATVTADSSATTDGGQIRNLQVTVAEDFMEVDVPRPK
jgi:hypothetical protein